MEKTNGAEPLYWLKETFSFFFWGGGFLRASCFIEKNIDKYPPMKILKTNKLYLFFFPQMLRKVPLLFASSFQILLPFASSTCFSLDSESLHEKEDSLWYKKGLNR